MEKKITRRELIGLNIEVVEAKNTALVGLKGKVIDETRNIFTLDNHKQIIKDQVVLDITGGNKKIRIEGERLVGRPEERIKK